MANGDVWKTVMGEAFKIKRPESGEDDKTYFTVKSATTGKYVSCTLWDNSHSQWLERNGLDNGDFVIVHGKIKSKTVGENTYLNMSIARIGKVALDAGIDTRADESGSEAAADAEEELI